MLRHKKSYRCSNMLAVVMTSGFVKVVGVLFGVWVIVSEG